jgi:hypothetical protein
MRRNAVDQLVLEDEADMGRDDNEKGDVAGNVYGDGVIGEEYSHNR